MALNLSPAEKKILKKINESNVITKTELKSFMTNESKGKDIDAVLDISTRALIQKNFIDVVRPIGSTCFVITQIGSRFIKDM